MENFYCELEKMYGSGEIPLEYVLQISKAVVDIESVSEKILTRYCRFSKTDDKAKQALTSLL